MGGPGSRPKLIEAGNPEGLDAKSFRNAGIVACRIAGAERAALVALLLDVNE